MSFTEFYCRQDGSNLNAGSTDSASPAFTTTAGDWVQSTRVFTKTGAISGVSVGDFASVYADGASAPTGYVARVTAVTANTITLSNTALSGTAPTDGTGNRTVRVGGAWGGSGNNDVSHAITFPAAAMTNAAGDQVRVNIKGGTTWNITTAIARTAAGPYHCHGYTTTAGDGGFAVIDGGTNAINLFNHTASGLCFAFLEFSNNGTTGTNTLVNGSGRTVFYRCRFKNSRGHGLQGVGTYAIECEASECNTSNTTNLAGFVNAYCLRCFSHDHTAGTNCHGFGTITAILCVADRCAGSGFRSISQTTLYVGCSEYNCVNGLSLDTLTTPVSITDSCNFVGNSSNGVSASNTSHTHLSLSSAFHSNTSGNRNANASLVTWEIVADTSLASNPYTDVSTGSRPSGGDFTILSTAGLGRAAGSGGFLQDSASYSTTTTSYPDRGAVQSQSVSTSTVAFVRGANTLLRM